MHLGMVKILTWQVFWSIPPRPIVTGHSEVSPSWDNQIDSAIAGGGLLYAFGALLRANQGDLQEVTRMGGVAEGG